VVDLPQEILASIPQYAKHLEGYSPRAIKFITETMIIKARRTSPYQLTNAIALETLSEAKRDIQQTKEWQAERDEWLRAGSTYAREQS
jgi:hypothetical protein